ncbi:Putative membrane protein ydgH [Legionella lansingensis]|uniref:Membrane protein YdfJ n=1 Tax=Legionella lansingensis TaxID=45067 RepID=A0A0W0VUU7_9GAMM|nr:MMPL family transporter [Legionella lansingensis]KTD23816.1 Membrane protein YdfJ [Legionella lansingensis]SNV46878.1 Putative membrane protein ydgH [Legionella lansingensis]
MKNPIFYNLGKVIYSLRWYIIVLWVLIILACVPFLPHIVSPFKTTGFIDESSESAKTEQYLNKTLEYNTNKFIIIYTSPKLLATNRLFIKKIKQSLEPLKAFPLKHEILLPSDNKKQISKDKHTAYVVVLVKGNEPLNSTTLDKFEKAIKKPANMTVEIGGESIFVRDVNKQTQEDLFKADLIAAPVAIITLIFVFGSIVAALLPIILGGGCALMILTTLFFIGHICTLSIFTLNIALLLGLCLSLDYSLFIVSRFRDELHHGNTIAEAIATTEATAGKAIFFSGLAVFVSLSALFLFPINILFSMAIGGLTAVVMAVATAIILLPAILSVLKNRINLLSLNFIKESKIYRFNVWHWIAEKVVRRPLLFFFPILIFLLLLGYPFLHAKFGVSDYKILPENSEHRDFFDTYAEKFNINALTPILVLIQTPHSYILSRKNLYNLYDLAKKLKADPEIDQINSIVTTDSKLTKKQYYTLYHLRKKLMSSNVKQLLATTTNYSFTVMSIISKHEINSPQTKELITSLHKMKVPSGMNVKLTGTPVINTEVLSSIARILPWAILWIIVFTYLILLILLRSVFLPIKAILMNLLSLCACYGALVLVFQDGYLSQLLNFEPQGMLDISLLVIIFCALFGFSMDYEVFLLTRIKEFYEANGVNNNSIVFGIEKSSRIITSAALIVIFICGSFLVADVLMVKAFGLGIAVAIFVDAFLIRTLLVPSTMALLKEWNWYLPKWLDRLLPKI